MCLQLSVILFTGRGRPQCMLGYHPPRNRHFPPRAVHAGRYVQQVGGMHPTGMQSCYHLQTKFAKVMFLHLSVSHSVHRGGGGMHGFFWGVRGFLGA